MLDPKNIQKIEFSIVFFRLATDFPTFLRRMGGGIWDADLVYYKYNISISCILKRDQDFNLLLIMLFPK